MHKDNFLVRQIALEIVGVYTRHLDVRVAEKDETYLSLGVDNTFERYSALFHAVISKLLGIERGTNHPTFPHAVMSECIGVLVTGLDKKGYSSSLDDMKISLTVYEVCQYALEKVRDSRFSKEVSEATKAQTKTHVAPSFLRLGTLEFVN